MNHQLWNAVGTRVLALAFVLAGLTACGDRISNTSAKVPPATPASPSTVVIGTAPAQPTGDPPGTTPVDPGTSDVTPVIESKTGPQPGQANDHSNVAPKPSQKSGEIATTEAEGKAANAGERK